MPTNDDIRLVLASQSPRRADLLSCLGLSFDVIPSQLVEQTNFTEPVEIVRTLAKEKADAVAKRLEHENDPRLTLVLAADTIVVLGRDVLGKPTSREDAYQMLVRMSGRSHRVYTAIALHETHAGQTTVDHEVTEVYFRSLDPSEIRAYARTEEPLDKAGAYALQGAASAFVEKIDGCYSNVIGLPVPLTVTLLRAAGLRILGLP